MPPPVSPPTTNNHAMTAINAHLVIAERDGYIICCLYSVEQVIKQSGSHTPGQLAQQKKQAVIL